MEKNELEYRLPKEKIRKPKKLSLPILASIKPKDPKQRMDVFMAQILFKGPGSRFSDVEVEVRCNHKPLPLSIGGMTAEASYKWFFKVHGDDVSALYCFLQWLDQMVAKYPEVNDDFLLNRWEMVEKEWEVRNNSSGY